MPKKCKKDSWAWWKNKTHTDYKKMIRLIKSDENGYGHCVVCGQRLHWKEFHAGHFNHGLDFVFTNYNLECPQCNYFGTRDAQNKYTLYMVDKHGRECVDDLMSRKTYLYKVYHFQAMRKVIRQIIKKLEKQKC